MHRSSTHHWFRYWLVAWWANQCWYFVNWTLRTNFKEILIEIHPFFILKMQLKTSSAKLRPFHLGLNVSMSWAVQWGDIGKNPWQRKHHNDFIRWKYPVDSRHKGQWRGVLGANNRYTGDLIRDRAHYDVIVVMSSLTVHFQQPIYKTATLIVIFSNSEDIRGPSH